MISPVIPRTSLATLPTPLTPAIRLSEELGVEIWFKRDDLTGLGLGGNKVRPLEFLIGAAEDGGADWFVTGGGPQSNWVMLAALAAVTRGLRAHVVFYGDPVTPTGNLLLLSTLPAVEITFTGDNDRASVDRGIEAIVADISARDGTPYAAGRGGATAVGALGYATAATEISDQLAQVRFTPASLWLATGSCGTQAGLVAGFATSHAVLPKVVGVSVSRPKTECRARISEISVAAMELLDATRVQDVAWEVTADQLDRYGKASQAGIEAAALVARTEGVFLDPVFGAKAMASLVAHASDSALDGPVLFLVTGGAPTLFATGAMT